MKLSPVRQIKRKLPWRKSRMIRPVGVGASSPPADRAGRAGDRHRQAPPRPGQHPSFRVPLRGFVGAKAGRRGRKIVFVQTGRLCPATFPSTPPELRWTIRAAPLFAAAAQKIFRALDIGPPKLAAMAQAEPVTSRHVINSLRPAQPPRAGPLHRSRPPGTISTVSPKSARALRRSRARIRTAPPCGHQIARELPSDESRGAGDEDLRGHGSRAI